MYVYKRDIKSGRLLKGYWVITVLLGISVRNLSVARQNLDLSPVDGNALAHNYIGLKFSVLPL